MDTEKIVLKDMLCRLLEDTYDSIKPYINFSISIVPKELKSKHGHYIPNDRKIEIFNLARPPGCTMLTCIHELAHHVEFMDLGETGHKKSFYSRFHGLLLSALSHGFVVPKDLEDDAKDSKDYKKLVGYFGDIEFWDYEVTEEAKKRFVFVFNGYHQREELKQRGYKYFKKSQAWGKEYPNPLYANREAKLLQYTFETMDIGVVSQATTLFTLNYYIAVPGAYGEKELLKQHGYRWGAYGVKGTWVKKVPTSSFYYEEAFLKDSRLVFTKVTPKM